MDDVRARADAVGSQKAALLGPSEGGPMGVVRGHISRAHDGAHPVRHTSSTIRDAAYPWAMDPDERQRIIAALPQTWGQGLYADF